MEVISTIYANLPLINILFYNFVKDISLVRVIVFVDNAVLNCFGVRLNLLCKILNLVDKTNY